MSVSYTHLDVYKRQADDMKELEPAEKSFLQGDKFFTDEHLQWETLKQKLLSCLLYTSM